MLKTASGLSTSFSTTSAGTTDETINIGFYPVMIELDWKFQGWTFSHSSYDIYQGKSIYIGTTKIATQGYARDVGTTTDDLNPLTTLSVSSPLNTYFAWTSGSDNIGSNSGSGSIQITPSMNAINANGFTFRYTVAVGSGSPNTARGKFAYKAWGY